MLRLRPTGRTKGTRAGCAKSCIKNGQPMGLLTDIVRAWVVWIAVTVALYPLCRWFAGVKRRRRSAFLSYL